MAVQRAVATSGARKLLLDAGVLVTSRFTQLGTQALYLIIAARLLGPEAYGQLNYAQSWYMIFFQFAALGLQSIVSREVGSGGSKAAKVVSGSTAAVMSSSVLLSVMSASIIVQVESDPLVQMATIVFSVAVFFRGMSVWAEMLLIAHEKGRRVLFITMSVRPFEPFAALLLLAAGHGIVALAVVHVISWGVQALVAWFVLIRQVDLPRPSYEPDVVLCLLRSGAPLMFGGAAMGFLQFGQVIVHRWITGDDLGQLAILVQIVMLLGVLPLSAAQILLPALSRRMVQDQKKALAIPASILSIFLLGGVLAATVSAPSLVRPLISLVLGSDFLMVAESLWLALILFGLYGAGLFVNQGLVLKGKYYSLFASTAGGALVFLTFRLGWLSYIAGPLELEVPVSMKGTLVCAVLGYAAWIVIGSALSGLTRIMAKAFAICAAAMAAFLVIEGPFGLVIAWVIVIGGSWLTGLIHTTLSVLKAQ